MAALRAGAAIERAERRTFQAAAKAAYCQEYTGILSQIVEKWKSDAENFFVIRPEAGLLRIMRRKLTEVGAGVFVSLDDSRAVRRDGDIPADMAHLRNFARRALGQRDGLRDHRQLIADEADVRIRMLVIDVKIIVRRNGDDPTVLRVDAAHDAAAPGVVAAAAARSDLERDIGDQHVLADDVGQDAQGIDGTGMQCCDLRMLGKHLLQNRQPVFMQVGQHGLGIRKIRNAQLFHAAAAVAVVRLGKNCLLSGAERGKLLRRGRLAVERAAAQIGREAFVEAVLVVKLLGVGIVVHRLQDLFVAHTRQIGVALSAVHGVKAEHGIVVIARAIAHGAPENAQEGARLAVTALFLDRFEDRLHFIESRAAHDAHQVVQIWHGLSPCFFTARRRSPR